jgi:hypothetical protein
MGRQKVALVTTKKRLMNILSVLQMNLYLLLPLDGERMPKLERPYLSCQPTLSVQHLRQVTICLHKCAGLNLIVVYLTN